jgi:hypothetical protein
MHVKTNLSLQAAFVTSDFCCTSMRALYFFSLDLPTLIGSLFLPQLSVILVLFLHSVSIYCLDFEYEIKEPEKEWMYKRTLHRGYKNKCEVVCTCTKNRST